jgi:hypothetical protein
MKRTLAALGGSGLLAIALLTGCSSGDPEPGPTTASTTPTPTETSSSPSPSRIVAVLCDEATEEQREAIEGLMDPEFEVTQLVDVRADDQAGHALLGFVQGPGLAVLAQWVGTGDPLTEIQAADEFAAESSSATLATDLAPFQDYLDNTVKCYQQVFAPDSDG